ncbi:MAG: hypothetical protein HOP28_04635 [Gemmatimonadales bacterium]|nr:hypothetical protein [Gemmatimonadales bacterium]
MKSVARTLPLLALLASTACTQSFDATSLGVPATMAAGPGETVAGTPFTVRTHSVHGALGLFTISQANLRKALATQLVGGQQVANLKIRSKSRWFDVLVTGITLGMIVPRTVTFEGVVIGR